MPGWGKQLAKSGQELQKPAERAHRDSPALRKGFTGNSPSDSASSKGQGLLPFKSSPFQCRASVSQDHLYPTQKGSCHLPSQESVRGPGIWGALGNSEQTPFMGLGIGASGPWRSHLDFRDLGLFPTPSLFGPEATAPSRVPVQFAGGGSCPGLCTGRTLSRQSRGAQSSGWSLHLGFLPRELPWFCLPG